jgi:aminocarboxymuconate-semialdehyde decarboxylase
MIVDAHAHHYPIPFLDEMEAQGERYPVQIRRDRAGNRVLRFDERPFFTFEPDFYDVEVRLAQMDRVGIGLQVLSIAPPMVFWAEPGLGLALCQIYNEELAKVVGTHRGRFLALSAVPLQDVGRAIEELRRSVRELGARGVLVGSNIRGQDLDAPPFEDFFAAAEELQAPVYIHPILPAGRERMRDYRLDILVGFPVDTTLAAARLVYGGLMERHPRLKVILSHLGGAVPFLWGRLSTAFETFEGIERKFSGDPRDYLRRFYYDSVIYSGPPLAFASALVGSEQILFGTDAPFFGEENLRSCLRTVTECEELTGEDRAKILSRNASLLFGVPREV